VEVKLLKRMANKAVEVQASIHWIKGQEKPTLKKDHAEVSLAGAVEGLGEKVSISNRGLLVESLNRV